MVPLPKATPAKSEQIWPNQDWVRPNPTEFTGNPEIIIQPNPTESDQIQRQDSVGVASGRGNLILNNFVLTLLSPWREQGIHPSNNQHVRRCCTSAPTKEWETSEKCQRCGFHNAVWGRGGIPGISGIPGLRLFPFSWNSALERKEMGIQDEHFQLGTQEMRHFEYGNRGNFYFPSIWDLSSSQSLPFVSLRNIYVIKKSCDNLHRCILVHGQCIHVDNLGTKRLSEIIYRVKLSFMLFFTIWNSVSIIVRKYD